MNEVPGARHTWEVSWTAWDVALGLAPPLALVVVPRLAPDALGPSGALVTWVGLFVWMGLFPLAWRRRRRGDAAPTARRPLDLTAIGWGMLVGVGLLLLALVVALVADDPRARADASWPARAADALPPTVMTVLLLVGATLGPVIEELFFRGFLLHALGRHAPRIVALGIQAALFGLAHGHGVVATAQIMVIGCALGLLAGVRGSLVACVSAHATFNLPIVVGWALALASTPGWLGVGIEPRPEGDAITLEVVVLTPGSPADAAGLRVGDRVVALDGAPVPPTRDEFVAAVRARPAGTAVVLDVRRGADPLTVRATLGARPPNGPAR